MWQYSTYGEELYHYKYIKREFKNGRWVYTYPGDAMQSKILQKGNEVDRQLAYRQNRYNKMFNSTSNPTKYYEYQKQGNQALHKAKKLYVQQQALKAADKALRGTASALDKLSDAKYKASKKAKSTMKKTVTKVKQQTDKGKAKIRSILLRRTSK